ITRYPGVDIGSDHNTLVADIEVNLKTIKRIRIPKKDTTRLQDSETRDKTTKDLNSKLNALTRSSSNNVDMQWNRLKKTINKVCLQNLNTIMNITKKRWMTTEILELMVKRRMAKNEPTTYIQLQNSIKGKQLGTTLDTYSPWKSLWRGIHKSPLVPGNP
ncbi:hypothetical protein HHI36_009321, partial [Cryptolaemus montrouzieri]